jgi:hypothetical protein
MEFLLILAGALAVGYFIARSRYSKTVDKTADQVVTTSKDLAGKTEDWWRKQFTKGRYAEALKGWAAGPGANLLPGDFKTWLNELPERDAQIFTQELFKHLEGLGYDLPKMVNRQLVLAPEQQQVFVETIVVYSQAYRKAKAAQQKNGTENNKEAANSEQPAQNELQPAEKSTSRRRGDGNELGEASSVS